MIPDRIFLTTGVGFHKYKLKSFEEALRKAGIANQNLVTVSSIMPPGCKLINKQEGLPLLKPGRIAHCVLSRIDTDEKGRIITSSVGLAVPKKKEQWGYISEAHEYGKKSKEVGELAEDLAADMLATTLGLSIDPDKDWSEKEQAYKASGLFVKTLNATQSAKGKEGGWTTVISVAIFLFPEDEIINNTER